jgi:hypothetical protein
MLCPTGHAARMLPHRSGCRLEHEIIPCCYLASIAFCDPQNSTLILFVHCLQPSTSILFCNADLNVPPAESRSMQFPFRIKNTTCCLTISLPMARFTALAMVFLNKQLILSFFKDILKQTLFEAVS